MIIAVTVSALLVMTELALARHHLLPARAD
jgi:hypothetical protein